MPFKKILEELVDEVQGAIGAILADWEGEAVEQAGRMDDYELRVLGAHQGIILEQLRGALGRVEHQLSEITIASEKTRILVLPITGEYFLVMALERSSPLGPARFAAGRTMERLKSEIL